MPQGFHGALFAGSGSSMVDSSLFQGQLMLQGYPGLGMAVSIGGEPPRKVRRWRKSAKFSSKYRGVTFQKRDSKYVARAWISKKIVHLGTFETEKEAARVVRDKYLEVYGEVPGMSQEDLKKLDEDDDDHPPEEDEDEEDEEDDDETPGASNSAASASATAVSDGFGTATLHSVDDPKDNQDDSHRMPVALNGDGGATLVSEFSNNLNNAESIDSLESSQTSSQRN